MEHDDREVSSGPQDNTVFEAEAQTDDDGADSAEDCSFVSAGDIVVRDIPELKVIEDLKNELGILDIGKTIKDLFVSMKNMDSQLKNVLAINAALEKDSKVSRDIIVGLNSDKRRLEQTVRQLQDEMPAKRVLQDEINHFIEERNEAQASIRSMKKWVGQTKEEIQGLKDRVAELESEKSDLTRDIAYYEIKFNAAVEKLSAASKEITMLRGEKLINHEKIENLKDQLRKCTNERNRLMAQKLDL